MAFDPEISEWGNPSIFDGDLLSNVSKSKPREVKHLSTERKREQIRVAFCSRVWSCEWKATHVIPQVAASEKEKAQTDLSPSEQ